MIPDSAGDAGPSGLRRALKIRHMQMIALGGVIGAGLFVGSGVVIRRPVPPPWSRSRSPGRWWCW